MKEIKCSKDWRDAPDELKSLFNRKPDLSDISDVIAVIGEHILTKDEKIVYHNLMTGKRSANIYDVMRKPKENIILSNYYVPDYIKAVGYNGYYLEYVKEFDVAICYSAKFDSCNNIEEGEIREWTDINVESIYTRDGSCYIYEGRAIGNRPIDMCEETLIQKDTFDVAPLTSRIDNENGILLLHEHVNKVWETMYGAGLPRGVIHFNNKMVANNFCAPFDCIKDFSYMEQNSKTAKKLLGTETLKELPVERIFRYLMPIIRKGVTKETDLDEYMWQLTSGFYSNEQRFGVLEHVRENTSVLRIFGACVDVKDFMLEATKEDFKTFEFLRIYAEGNDIYFMRKMFGKWTIIPLQERDIWDLDYILLPWKPEDSIGTIFSYFDKYVYEMMEQAYKSDFEKNKKYTSDLVNGDIPQFQDSMDFSEELLNMASHQMGQDIMTSGFENIKKFFIENIASETFKTLLIKTFDVKHELVSRNQMNLWKCIDAPMSDIKVLDKQLGDFSMQKDIHFTKQDRYSKFKKDCEQNVVEAKRFVGFSFAMVKKYFEGNEEYFKRMNSKQYEEISNLYIKLISSSYVTANMKSGDVAIRKLVLLKGPQNIANYIQYVHGYLVHTVAKEKFGWDDNEVIFNSEIQSIITMYTDYLSMCLDMRNWDDVIQRPEWKFKTYEEIETAHINITEVYNNLSDEQASKRVQKGFDKQKQNWDKFRYDGTRFSVIAPETPYDVINEGIALHHCVKTYLDNIANGETTILFVRKNGELEKPFYTLEVKNNEIRQCHGFANCNTDKEDGLINFLHEYCRKKKIRYSDGNMCLVAN